MAFDDLPENWDTQPISDPRLTADVLDLFVSEKTRIRGGLLLLVCDRDDRLQAPIEISPLPGAGDDSDRTETLGRLAAVLHRAQPGGRLLAAIARDGGLSVTPDDRAWAQVIAGAFADRLDLIGIHLVTMDGSRPVPRPPLAA